MFLINAILLLSIAGNYYVKVFQYFLENFLHLVAVIVLLICYNTATLAVTNTTASWLCIIISAAFVLAVFILIVRVKLLRNIENKTQVQ